MTVVLSLFRGLIELRKPCMADITALVAARHGLTAAQLRGPDRQRKVAHPRQEAYALIRQQSPLSYPQIGTYFNRHHTTIIDGERAYYGRLEAVRQARAA